MDWFDHRETIGGAPLAQPRHDHEGVELTHGAGSEPAQRAGIRNHKVVIDSLLMITA